MNLLEINNRIIICESNIARLKHSSIYHEDEKELRINKLNKELESLQAEKENLIKNIEIIGIIIL